IARKHNIPLAHDVGSGTLVDLKRFGLAHEPTIAEAIADGADVVTFCGDKIRLAALEATLKLYRDPDRLTLHLPTMRHLARPLGKIEALAHRLAAAVAERLNHFD